MSLRIAITGANRGIGLELTKQALNLGHQVIAGVRDPGQAPELYQLRYAKEGRLIIQGLDVTSDQSAKAFAQGAGPGAVDVLINNAGAYLDTEAETATVAPDIVLQTLNINAVGPLRVTQALLPLLKMAALPRVANITSLMGSITDNSAGGSVAYRMSKAALNMFTKNLAIDERDLTVICLHPGWVKTDMGGKQAPMTPAASAEGLLSVILNVKHGDSGRFLNYAGREHPW